MNLLQSLGRFSPHTKCVFATALCMANFSARSEAALATYSTISDFDAATTGDSPYSFPIPQGSFQAENSPYTVGPVGFSTPAGLFLINDNQYGTGQTYLAATRSSGATSIEISLAGATALSFEIGTYFGNGSVSVVVDGVPETGLTTFGGHPSAIFYGVTSDVPITDINFTTTAGDPGEAEIDVLGFQVGSAVAVPEPASTLAFLIVGLLAGRKRRRV